MHLTVYSRIKTLETVLEKVKNELIETNSDCLDLNRFLLYAPTQKPSQEVFKRRSRFQISGDRKTCKYCVTLSSPDLCFDAFSPPPHPTPTHPHITESPHAAQGCLASQATSLQLLFHARTLNNLFNSPIIKCTMTTPNVTL